MISREDLDKLAEQRTASIVDSLEHYLDVMLTEAYPFENVQDATIRFAYSEDDTKYMRKAAIIAANKYENGGWTCTTRMDIGAKAMEFAFKAKHS